MEPNVAFNCVVSAERRETISPVFSELKKLGSSRGQMREEIAAQVGDDPLAERHHEIVARARSEREHRDDADHRGEIDVDQPGIAPGEPKSIMPLTAKGTASVAAEATASATNAPTRRPRWRSA